ncbi:hypothetical protein GCM10007147_27910 [Nocardiopsis kunsanensis]|uniref:Uncharacterized protein n=1 Tax=Nocardiopsis kunsanensis TaxID=141693 RepID=A0A918XF86_9ACTN|nr:hypothetical protein GCM10007147_27910 [Nocardiopsis kunsanensis]
MWDFYFDRDEPADTMRRYDREALTEPCWAQTTLCGRLWVIMAGGDGGAVGRHGEVASPRLAVAASPSSTGISLSRVLNPVSPSWHRWWLT